MAPCHGSCTLGLAGISRWWIEVGRQRVQQAGAAAMRGVKAGGGVGVAPHGPYHVPPHASAFATVWPLHAQFLPSNPIQPQPWSCPMCLHPCISGALSQAGCVPPPTIPVPQGAQGLGLGRASQTSHSDKSNVKLATCPNKLGLPIICEKNCCISSM